MKKFLAILMASAVVSGTMGLVACDKDGNDEQGNSYTVTADEWVAAIDSVVEAKDSFINEIGNSQFTVKYDKMNEVCGYVYPDGNGGNSFGNIYVWGDDDGKYYFAAVRFHTANGIEIFDGEKYIIEKDDFGTMVKEVLFDEGVAYYLSPIKNKFDDFTYDENKCEYHAVLGLNLSGEEDPDTDETITYEYNVKFENKKIISFTSSRKESENKWEKIVWTFTYDNITVTVPDYIKDYPITSNND